jgi:hypothetical protein
MTTTTYPPINYSQFCGMSAYDIQVTYYRGQGLPPNWSWDECLKACPDMEDPRTNTNTGEDITFVPGQPVQDYSNGLSLTPNQQGNLLLPGTLQVTGGDADGGSLSMVALGVVENGVLRPIQYHGQIGYSVDGGPEVVTSAYAGPELSPGNHTITFRELEGVPNRPVVLNIIYRE